MNIVNKITLLILFLLLSLGVNTWTGLRQMGSIRAAFAAMADHDVVLMEAVTALHQLQLQKAVLLQRTIGIAEELGFEQTSFARSSYLRDELKNIRQGMQVYANGGSQEMLRARAAAAAALDVATGEDQRDKLRGMMVGLNRMEEARRGYDTAVAKILQAVDAGGFQLSLEDLEGIQQEEGELSARVEKLLKEVQAFSHNSLGVARAWEAQAREVLLILLGITVIIGCLFALWLIRSIVRPLRALSAAARQVGEGNFKVQLNTSSRDELAEVAVAFNTMSAQLEAFKTKLEKQNTDLKNANEDLDRFIHIIGHDIADPLTMMIAYCAYIEQHAGPSMEKKSVDALQGIRRASTKMHEMVKNLLQFAKSRRLEG